MGRRALLQRAISLLLLVLAVPVAHAADPLANGVFLIAAPDLQDPNFRETVVLITLPEPGGGPLGVIVNRPTERTLAQIFPENAALKASPEKLYAGGPVARTGLLFVFRASEAKPGALRVLDTLYLSGRVEILSDLLARERPAEGLRIFAGYAGWAPGQLQAEIARGGWYVLPADPAYIFHPEPARVWSELVGKAVSRRTGVEPASGALAFR